tara:strand:+ start:382 stop:720 length:339 start_codon:yes stop_codon:yes gene_type:complete
MKYKGSCHCGAIKFEINAVLDKIKQCNCSICIRKYAKMGMANINDIKILEGKEFINVYEFGTKVAKHYFCKKCGIYTHHKRKSDPNGVGVNMGCLEGIDPFNINSEVLNNKN